MKISQRRGRETDDILDVSVETDPTLGPENAPRDGLLYKVPSLRGVWYRNAFPKSEQFWQEHLALFAAE
jgi:hypothetical protein